MVPVMKKLKHAFVIGVIAMLFILLFKWVAAKSGNAGLGKLAAAV